MDLTSLSLRVVLSPGFFPAFDVREDRQVSPLFECESLEAPSPLVFPQVWVFDSSWWSSFFQYSSSPSLLFYSWSDQTFWRVFFLQLSVFTLSALCVFQSVCLYRLDVCNVALVDYPVQALSKALRSSRLTVLHLQHVQLSGMPLYTLGKTCPCASLCTRRLFFCNDF